MVMKIMVQLDKKIQLLCKHSDFLLIFMQNDNDEIQTADAILYTEGLFYG